MYQSDRYAYVRWAIIIGSFLIAILILWNTHIFFEIFKQDERDKMELLASAQESLMKANENTELDLPLFIINSNTTIPLLLTDSKEKIQSFANVDDNIIRDTMINNTLTTMIKDSISLKKLLKEMKSQNKPIRVVFGKGKDDYQLLCYGDSPLLLKLKYYPIALLSIIFMFGLVVFNFYRATKVSSQNKLWAGMAKETAHQIGTPLFSLIGWLEILRLENVDETTIQEMEKDIHRLQNITDRFSKIGSEPVLEELDLINETKMAFEYLKSRSSKQVDFTFIAPEKEIFYPINHSLHSWTIENLVKNAIDAMKGQGKIEINIIEKDKFLHIQIKDSGCGIPRNTFNSIFEPGFTTKKRGWGLGLSLTKRIVEDYHSGWVKVLHSEIGKGTTMQITFKVVQ